MIATEEELAAALAGSESQSLRVAACRAIATELSRAAQAISVGARTDGNKALESLAVTGEMAGELGAACIALFENNLLYAGSVVVRQLIEVEYLLFLFGVDGGEAQRWIEATPSTIRTKFQPKELRRRSKGQFQDKEYWNHCDIGGHPNPKGRIVLGSYKPRYAAHAAWTDLTQHLVRLVTHFTISVRTLGYDVLFPNGYLDRVEEAVDAWYDKEHPAFRDVPLSLFT